MLVWSPTKTLKLCGFTSPSRNPPLKSGKVRVVFDCTAKFRDTSLNDMLLSGPDLLQNLIGVLLRFRLGKIAFTSDIQVMFHQVKVPLVDQKFLRFLWWPQGDTAKEPEEHCMTVHIFGAKSSRSVANFALLQTAQDNAHHFNGEVLEKVRTNFYADDCLKSVNSVEEARKLVHDFIELLKLGGFQLKKWLSNEPSVLSQVDTSDRAHTDLNLDLNSKTTENVLGVKWDFTTDILQMHIHVKSKPVTRRGLLSIISSVFDALGMVAPVVLNGKLILQQLCRKGISWDESLPPLELDQWKCWLTADGFAESIYYKYSRYMFPRYVQTDFENIQVHHFSDASSKGYGTVSYLRVVKEKGEVHCTFLFAKARLAPLKTVSIPRL